MRKIILLLLALLATTFGYSSHHHSHHSHHSSHHSTHHTSSHSNHSYGSHSSGHSTLHESNGGHPYHPVSTINRKNVRYNHSNMSWYYLLRNNHTNTNDTIKANTLEELNDAVVVATTPEDNSTFYWTFGVFSFLVIAVVLFAKHKSRL